MPENKIKRGIQFKPAKTAQDFEDGKKLFQQYAGFLGIDLSFQKFEEELQSINKQYHTPKGALLLAYDGKKAVGCVGLRQLDDTIGELKRMFVQSEYQGQNIGKTLLEQILTIAKDLGYQKIRLDTLPNMDTAQKLYHLYGFYEISAYRFNPIEGTVYMEKDL